MKCFKIKNRLKNSEMRLWSDSIRLVLPKWCIFHRMQSPFVAGVAWQNRLESIQPLPNLCIEHEILLHHRLVSCQKCIRFLWTAGSCFVLWTPGSCFVLWTAGSCYFPVPVSIAMPVDPNLKMHKTPVHIFIKKKIFIKTINLPPLDVRASSKSVSFLGWSIRCCHGVWLHKP